MSICWWIFSKLFKDDLKFSFSELLSFQNCDCVQVRKCQWSKNSLESVEGLPKSDPKVRAQVEFIKKHICDKKKKLVYCCGSKQQPPIEEKFPKCEHKCSKNPRHCDIKGTLMCLLGKRTQKKV